MKGIQYKKILQLALLMGIAMGCSESSSSQEAPDEVSISSKAQTSTDEIVTSSGVRYRFIDHGSGSVPDDGGYWTINIAYYNEKGDTIFSSTDQGAPLPLLYYAKNMKKNAALEECFSLLGKGDSAVFYISADSLYKNSAGGATPPDLIGTKLQINIGIDDVFTFGEFQNYTKMLENDQIDQEKAIIEEYLAEKGIDAAVTSEGLYYQITKEGNGERPRPGQSVRVNYTGYLLDGTVFDSSVEATAKEANTYTPSRQYEPYKFALGTGNVIKGWDIGIGYLSVGGKATLIIPSPLAYGSRGAAPLIKANSPLVFTVELVEIVK